MGLLYLIRRPEIDNRIYEGHRMKSSQSSTEELIITDVGKKNKESVIPFRRRIVDSKNQAWDVARELTNSLQPNLRDYIKEEFGDIFYNVHYVTFSKNDKKGRWSYALSRSIYSAGCIGTCYDNRSQLEYLVDRALERREKAVISIYGSNPPRELEELPLAHIKRPHIRRSRRIVLVLGGGFTGAQANQIKQLFQQKRDGRQLTQEQEKQLKKFFDFYNINDPTQVDFQKVDTKDDLKHNQQHQEEKNGQKYIIRPRKMFRDRDSNPN